MLTVACVWVEANVPFTPDYVWRLRAMVRKHLSVPHRFVCLTDRPSLLLEQNCDVIEIPKPQNGNAGWWSKIELFSPHQWLYGPVLYFDLDVLIVNSLELIAGLKTDLALIPHAGAFEGRGGKRVVKRYNSSVMRFEAGKHPELYTDFNASVTRRLWGDQDWIGERLPNQTTMPLAWFPRISEIHNPPKWPLGTKVVLMKRPKNHIAAMQWPWFDEAWGAGGKHERSQDNVDRWLSGHA